MAFEDKRDSIIRENIPDYVLHSIQCSVCLNIMEDPTVASNCGHSACSSCLSRTDICPMRCGSSTPNCTNYNILGMVSQLPAKCYLQCPWTGLYGDLDGHLESDCPYEICKKRCGSKIDRGTYVTHQAVCPKEAVKCQACDISVERGLLDTHLQKHCQKAMLTCQKCIERFAREAFPLHTVMCTERVRPCSIYGCSGIVTDRTVDDHLREAASNHVSLLQAERSDLLMRAYESPMSITLEYNKSEVDHRKYQYLVNPTKNGKVRFPSVSCFGAKWTLTIDRISSVITTFGLAMTESSHSKDLIAEVVCLDLEGNEEHIWKLKKEFKENEHVQKTSYAEKVMKIVLFLHLREVVKVKL